MLQKPLHDSPNHISFHFVQKSADHGLGITGNNFEKTKMAAMIIIAQPNFKRFIILFFIFYNHQSDGNKISE